MDKPNEDTSLDLHPDADHDDYAQRVIPYARISPVAPIHHPHISAIQRSALLFVILIGLAVTFFVAILIVVIPI